jgi:hypothetical protein
LFSSKSSVPTCLLFSYMFLTVFPHTLLVIFLFLFYDQVRPSHVPGQRDVLNSILEWGKLFTEPQKWILDWTRNLNQNTHIVKERESILQPLAIPKNNKSRSDQSRAKILWISIRKYSIVLFVICGNQNLFTHSCMKPLLGIHSWTKSVFRVHVGPCSCFWYPFQIQVTRNKSTDMKWRSNNFISFSPAWGVFFWQKWLFTQDLTYLFWMKLDCQINLSFSVLCLKEKITVDVIGSYIL